MVFPSSGQLGLDLMCGGWGAAKCSALRWYGFMGDAEEDVVPFQINYLVQKSAAKVDGFTPFNPRVIPCNESVDVRIRWCRGTFETFSTLQGIRPACSCMDCVSSCAQPPPPEPAKQKFLINNLDGLSVVMFIVFLFVSALFMTGTFFCSTSEAGELSSETISFILNYRTSFLR